MSLSHISTNTSKPVQTVSPHTVNSEMTAQVKSNHSKTLDNQRQPLPKGSNQRQPLPKGSKQQQHLPKGSNQQQSLPKVSNQQQPLPKGSKQQHHLPKGLNQHYPLPNGSNQLQHYPKSSSANKKEDTFSEGKIPKEKVTIFANNTYQDAAPGSQDSSSSQNPSVSNSNNCSGSRVSPNYPLSSTNDSKSILYGAAATVDSRADVEVTDSVVTIQPATKSPKESPIMSIPDTHLPIGIMVTCCFISPFGIAAMFFSLRAAAAYRDGFGKKGASRARTSVILSMIGITVTMLIIAGFVCYISVDRHHINKEAPQSKNALGF